MRATQIMPGQPPLHLPWNYPWYLSQHMTSRASCSLTPSPLPNPRSAGTDLIAGTKGMTALKGHFQYAFPSFSKLK